MVCMVFQSFWERITSSVGGRVGKLDACHALTRDTLLSSTTSLSMASVEDCTAVVQN